jgi:hypothetical protein
MGSSLKSLGGEMIKDTLGGMIARFLPVIIMGVLTGVILLLNYIYRLMF